MAPSSPVFVKIRKLLDGTHDNFPDFRSLSVNLLILINEIPELGGE
jgi:hypothetical protein